MKTIKSQVWYLEMRREVWRSRQLEESQQTEDSLSIEQEPRSPEYQGQEVSSKPNEYLREGLSPGTKSAYSGLPEGFSAVPLYKPDTSIYLELYKSVGSSYNWCDRLLMPEEELEKILLSDTTEVCLLKYNDESAGFVEFDKSVPGETEMVYFGLIVKFTGKKAGFPFLQWAINHAMEKGINRVWLHTCDLDHPAALPLYQKAGFTIYKTETVDQPVVEQ